MKFEMSLQSGGVFKRMLSNICALLLQNKGFADINRIRWERELKREISLEECYSMHALIRMVTMNTAIKENV